MIKFFLKFILLFFHIFFSQNIFSQTFDNYSVILQCSAGSVIKLDDHQKYAIKNPIFGFTAAVEWQTMGERNWHYYFNYPRIGLGATFSTLGNAQMYGNLFSIYPYAKFPLLKKNYFSLNLKPGIGISFVTKYYGNTPHIENKLFEIETEANGSVGSLVNVFFYLGINLEIPVNQQFSISTDFAWNHASNGSITQPNHGINPINTFWGIKYTPQKNIFKIPQRFDNVPDISRKMQFELTLSGGVRQLYYREKTKYPIASVAFSASKPVKNWYRVGVGLDIFYNGIFGYVNYPWREDVQFRTWITEDKFKNKVRAGISWQNELIIGQRFTAGFHVGIYLIDPIKNLQPYGDAAYYWLDHGTYLKRSIFYKYSRGGQDGWNYFRFIAKYRFSNHCYALAAVKTHLGRAEFVEWGIGYRF